MKVLKTSFSIILFTLIIFSSCTKEGKQGDPGVNGADGNANVKSVGLTTSTWYWDSTSSTRYYVWNGITNLTYDIASYGSVHLYQLNSTEDGYFQLPITAPISAGVVESDYYEYGQGTIAVYIQNSNLSDPLGQISTPTNYKLVTISASARVANPNVDYTNYNEVAKAFNLE